MVDIPPRRSPLGDYTDAFAVLPNLRVDPDSAAAAPIGKALCGPLPTVPCTASRLGDADVLWLGPDEWLLLADPGQQQVLAATLRDAIGEEDGYVTDVSAQRTAVALTGPKVREVLASGCSIDLHPKATPLGSCVQALLAQTGVVRDEDAAGFLLLVWASFAGYFADWLVDACTEL